MRSIGRVAPALVITCVVLASCGSPGPGAATQPDPSPSPSPAYLYTCGRSPFDPALLEAHGDVEHEDSDLGQALRDLMETPDGEFLKRAEGWRVTYEDDERVEVLAGTAEDGFVDAAFEPSGGAWEAAGWGDCQPRVFVGDRSPVTWELEQGPSPNATELVVEAGDIGCSSGRKLTQQNTTYEIDYTEEAISILITGDPHMGGDCVGRSWPLKIELAGPVGGRALLDAAHYPPKQRHP